MSVPERGPCGIENRRPRPIALGCFLEKRPGEASRGLALSLILVGWADDDSCDRRR
jgi:hypothetical protein